jgi:hypothetical protein
MSRSKRPPTWPPDDQVRELDELEDDREFTDDGRKVSDSERVGGMAPDADAEPDHRFKRPRHRSRR